MLIIPRIYAGSVRLLSGDSRKVALQHGLRLVEPGYQQACLQHATREPPRWPCTGQKVNNFAVLTHVQLRLQRSNTCRWTTWNSILNTKLQKSQPTTSSCDEKGVSAEHIYVASTTSIRQRARQAHKMPKHRNRLVCWKDNALPLCVTLALSFQQTSMVSTTKAQSDMTRTSSCTQQNNAKATRHLNWTLCPSIESVVEAAIVELTCEGSFFRIHLYR
jgi:hypothetical protein